MPISANQSHNDYLHKVASGLLYVLRDNNKFELMVMRRATSSA